MALKKEESTDVKDFAPHPSGFKLSEELSGLLYRAALISERSKEEFNLSFTSILTAPQKA